MSLLADTDSAPVADATPPAAAPDASATQSAAQSQAPTTTQAAAPSTGDQWFKGLLKDNGELDHSVWDKAPAELQAYKSSLAQNKNLNALLMEHVNLKSLAGRKVLAPLPEGASQQARDERDALLRKVNRTPDKIEDYGVKKPEDIPDGLWDPELANVVLGALHKHAASPEMVKDIFEADRQSTLAAIAKQQAAEAAWIEEEKREVKEAFGADYEKKADLAVRGMKTLGLDPKDPIFNNARLVIAMARFAESISEDKLVSGDSQQQGGGSDRVRALDIINNSSNPMHKAYHDPSDPMHEQAKNQVNTFMAAGAKGRR